MKTRMYRNQRVVELAEQERALFRNSYRPLVIDAVGTLCMDDAPVAVVLRTDPHASARSREAGVQRTLKSLGLDQAFTCWRKGNVVFIGSTEVFKAS